MILKTSIKIIITFFVVISSVLLIDFFFGRFFLKNDETLYRVRHPVFHHTLKASHFTERAMWYDVYYNISTDAHGFKTSRENINRNTKYFDIALIGDSMAEGVGFSYENTYIGLIGKNLKNKEIAQMSVSSYSAKIYLSKLKYYYDQNFEFKNVFIHYDISDLVDDYVNYDYVNGMVFDKNTKSNTVPMMLYYFVKSLPLTYKTYHYLKNFQNRNLKSPNIFDIPAGEYLYKDGDTIFKKGERLKAYDETFAYLEKISDLCKKNNTKLNIIISPWPSTLKNYDKNNLFEKKFKEFCEVNCNKFINTFPYFVKLSEQVGYENISKKYFFHEINDHHFNIDGHRIMSELILKEIKKN